jgi:hypothetical protein
LAWSRDYVGRHRSRGPSRARGRQTGKPLRRTHSSHRHHNQLAVAYPLPY